MTLAKIHDPEVQLLATLSATLEADYVSDPEDPWVGSPFAWILKQPSRTKGAIAEKLVAGWCATKGFDVVRSRHSDADRVVEGHRLEIKFSTMWKNGIYKFQQIREQGYDHCFCLGVSPFDARAWLLPKPVLRAHVIGHMGQHTGASGGDSLAEFRLRQAITLDGAIRRKAVRSRRHNQVARKGAARRLIRSMR